MKQFYILLALTGSLMQPVSAQYNLLSFDGNDDYVDLGSNAVTAVRTYELWFTPAVNLNANSPLIVTLFSRNDLNQTDEVNMVIYPQSFGTNAGRLAFHRNISGVNNYVVSNDNSWSAGVCYHVAGVIDPVDGLKLYVNGVLQTDTDPTNSAPATATEITTLGCHGYTLDRLFNGKMDEVRFWSTARTGQEIADHMYVSFNPAIVTPGLVGYWGLNEGTGTIANDAAPGNNDGTIVGATWVTTGNCLTGINEQENVAVTVNVYPNPADETSVIAIQKPAGTPYDLKIMDASGKEVYASTELTQEKLNISELVTMAPGMYLATVNLEIEGQPISTGVRFVVK